MSSKAPMAAFKRAAAPDDARDPHGYADGSTLDSGPYVLAGPRQLRLADEHNFGSVLVDRLERSYAKTNNATSYETQFWFGRDYDRLVIKAEGEIANGKLEESSTEVLWGHAIAPYWDAQLGLRYNTGAGPDRTWLSLGVQGLAPYWFEINRQVAPYIGVERTSKFGQTADMARAVGDRTGQTRWVAGVRFWY